MAMADYRQCDVCGCKAFYDANLNYEWPDKNGKGSYGQKIEPTDSLARAAGFAADTKPYNELLKETKELVERPKRKDRISGITIRPVGLPVIGQGEMFK